MIEEIERLKRRLEREKLARQQAERLLEQKSLELYQSNLSLQSLADELEIKVRLRTEELEKTLQELESTNRDLKASQSRLKQQMFAINQHTLVTMADLNGKLIYVNDNFVATSGYAREELLGRSHNVVNSGAQDESFFKSLWETIEAGKVWSDVVCNRKKSGELYWQDLTIVPFLDEDGNLHHYLSISNDVSNLKKTQESLQLSVNELNERVKIWRCLNEVTEILENDSAPVYEMLQRVVNVIPNGWPNPEVTHVVLHTENLELSSGGELPEHCQSWEANLAGHDQIKQLRVLECEFEGHRLSLSDELYTLIDAIASHVNTALVRRKTSEDLSKAKEAAEASNLAKGNFLANMSHEIRTPMNGILGMTDLALNTNNINLQREYVQIAHDSARSLLVIIDDVLDLSKIEAGKLSLEHVSFNLKSAISDWVKPLSSMSLVKGLGLRLDLGDRLPQSILGDPFRIRQIVNNLIGNAIKFTEAGYIELSVQMLSKDEKSARIRYSVSDTGIGIDQKRCEAIFENFSQADNSTTRKFGGTGLGLSICKRLVELMGGNLQVKSTLGEGAEFYFELEHELSKEILPEVIAPLESRQISLPDGDIELNILLVEDDKVNVLLAKRLLVGWGHTVTVSEDGADALARITSGECYDLILMDMQMPVMDGLEATEKIREYEQIAGLPNTPIIGVTANAMDSDRDACIDAGMDDFLTKPLKKDEFRERIQKLGREQAV